MSTELTVRANEKARVDDAPSANPEVINQVDDPLSKPETKEDKEGHRSGNSPLCGFAESDSMERILALYRDLKQTVIVTWPRFRQKDRKSGKRKFIGDKDIELVKREFIECLENIFGRDGGEKFIGIQSIRQCRIRSTYEFKFKCLLTADEIRMLKGCEKVVKTEVKARLKFV